MELEFLRKEVSKLKTIVGVSSIYEFMYDRKRQRTMAQRMNLVGILNHQKKRKLQSFLKLKHQQEEVLVHLFPLRYLENGTKRVISKLPNTIRHL